MGLTLAEVPQDEWGGYPSGNKDEEIPCRRMRSGSYIKAMGDEESGDSDTSPKTSPKASARPEPLLKSLGQRPVGDHQNQSYLQTSSEMPTVHILDPSPNYNSPKFRSRNQSYMRAVSTLSQASCVSQDFLIESLQECFSTQDYPEIKVAVPCIFPSRKRHFTLYFHLTFYKAILTLQFLINALLNISQISSTNVDFSVINDTSFYSSPLRMFNVTNGRLDDKCIIHLYVDNRQYEEVQQNLPFGDNKTEK